MEIINVLGIEFLAIITFVALLVMSVVLLVGMYICTITLSTE